MQTDANDLIENSGLLEHISGNIEKVNSICRDFLRNVCKRGSKCRYSHPDNLVSTGYQLDPVFCHDFQNGACRRQNCKFVHCTKIEEEEYRSNGILPAATATSNQVLDGVPVCKDFLNNNCHRGAQCRFRHGRSRPNQSTSEQLPSQNQHTQPHPSFAIQSQSTALPVFHTFPISHNSNQQSQSYAENSMPVEYVPPQTVATGPETTAMVAAAAAASYMAIQNQHQHQSALQGHEQLRQLEPQLAQNHHQTAGAGVLPPASAAAAFAAAAAATAFATTARHRQQHTASDSLASNPPRNMYNEGHITVSQSTSIPVMQSMLEAVALQPNALHSMVSAPPAYSAAVNSLATSSVMSPEGTCSFFRTKTPSLSANVGPGNPSMNFSHCRAPVSSANFFIPVSASTTVSSNDFQHDANTAAAVAAAACFGAMFSQPVAAAPTSQTSVSQQQATSSQHHAPPASAVAAAAAAAVAAAVVSSASRTSQAAPMVAISTHHPLHPPLGTVTTSCSFIASSIAAAADGASRVVARLPHASILSGTTGRTICSTDVFFHAPSAVEVETQRSLMGPQPTVPSSAAASVAYTATMTTAAAAAAAMAAAAVAVEEHQQNAAAVAAMAAFKDNAALMHGVSPESFGSSAEVALNRTGRVFLNSELVGSAAGARGCLRPRHKRRQSHFAPLRSFDVEDELDISCSEDEEIEESVGLISMEESAGRSIGEEISTDNRGNDACSHRNDETNASINRSGSPDQSFGRSLPLVNKPRQRSFSFPSCAGRTATVRHRLTLSPPELVHPIIQSPSEKARSSFSTVATGRQESKRRKLVSAVLRRTQRPTTKISRHRYVHQEPRRVYSQHTSRKQFELVSELEDDGECYLANGNAFFSPAHVVTPLFRERIYALKQENVHLRLSLQRLVQQKNNLQAENNALIKQNLKLQLKANTDARVPIESVNSSRAPGPRQKATSSKVGSKRRAPHLPFPGMHQSDSGP